VTRPAFSLSDGQAKQILLVMQDLLTRYPHSRQNRPILEGLIRAAHCATGRFFGVQTYQRLLNTYAPGRRPSTATILAAKRDVERRLFEESAWHEKKQDDDTAGVDYANHKVARHTRAEHWADRELGDGLSLADATTVRLLQLELEDQRRRRQQAEAHNASVQERLHIAAAELAHVQGRLQAQAQELREMRERLTQLTELAMRAQEIEVGQRNFTLQAIESARTENRLWRERYEGIEALRKEERNLMETYRRQTQAQALELARLRRE